jgi:hypothetical protein
MNNYYISTWMWKCMKKLLLHLLDLSILNSFIPLIPRGSKLSYSYLKLALVRDLIQEAGRMPGLPTAPQERQTPFTSQPP